MKLQVSNTNAPVWRDITVKSDLPSELKPLEELAKNLWWVWNSKGKSLFRELNPDLWRATGENPVMLLQQLSFERLQEIIADKELMLRIEKVSQKRKEIEDIIDPTTFVLNPRIKELEQEINELQSMCKHCFVEGVCIHCTKEETK